MKYYTLNGSSIVDNNFDDSPQASIEYSHKSLRVYPCRIYFGGVFFYINAKAKQETKSNNKIESSRYLLVKAKKKNEIESAKRYHTKILKRIKVRFV